VENDLLRLVLLSLPLPLTSIEGHPAFRRDACPAQFVHQWDVMISVSKTARPRYGPKPVLFTTNPGTLCKVLELSRSAAARVEEGNNRTDL
jgi:hypothetical protein